MSDSEHYDPLDGLTRRALMERAAAVGAAIPLAGLLPSVAQAAAAVVRPKRGGRLRVGFSGGPNEVLYAPAGTPLFIDGFRGAQLVEALLQVDRYPNQPLRPRLAESVEPDKTHTRWTFRLRRDVVFHNGKSLTARDVLYTLRFNGDKKNGFAYGANLVENLDLSASKIIDKRTLLLVQKRPTLDPDPYCTAIGILPEGFRDLAKLVGTGAFALKSFKPGDRSRFTRNPDYWVTDKPYLDEVEIISFSDPAAKLNALLGGQIDALDGIQPAQAQALASNTRIKIVRAKGSLNSAPQFTLRVDQKPFDDNRVRLAMKLAIDREAIVDRLLLGFGSVHNDIYYSPLDPYYNKRLPQRKYDPDRAAFWLKKAGHEKLSLDLVVPQGYEDAAALYKASAAQAKINISVDVIDPTQFWSQAYLKAPFTITTWGSTGFDGFYYQCCTPDAAYNETHMSDQEMLKLVDAAGRTFDRRKRTALLWELQNRFWKHSGYILPATADLLDATARNVHGIIPTPLINLGGGDFRSVWKS